MWRAGFFLWCMHYGVNGHLGYSHDFEDGEREANAKFATVSQYSSVMSQGLGGSAFSYGVGAYYDITDDLRFGVNTVVILP